MKVVVVWNGPANAAERDPLARRQVPLLARLEKHGIFPSVILLGDEGGLRRDLEAAAIPVGVLPISLAPRPAAVAQLPAAVVRLRSMIRRVDPDVIEGDEPLPAIAVGLAARPRARAVLVYRRHHQAGRRRLILASRLAAHLTDRTIVSCEAMRRCAATDDRTSLDRIEVAVSGTVDMEPLGAPEVAAARRALGIDPAARIIGVVSRLRKEKGLDVLLGALQFLETVGDLHVVVTGVGPEESTLRQTAARSPVPVHFLGHQQDVRVALGIADVIAIPSRHESLGRVTLEAMAAARPLVGCNVGGLGEAIIHGETGWLVPPENSAALAAALQTMLADPALARRMGHAARTRYEERYTIDHMARAWREVWERVACTRRQS